MKVNWNNKISVQTEIGDVSENAKKKKNTCIIVVMTQLLLVKSPRTEIKDVLKHHGD